MHLGSTFKMVPALAGLETGAITIDEKIKDNPFTHFTITTQPYSPETDADE